jgi:hypothetical protein
VDLVVGRVERLGSVGRKVVYGESHMAESYISIISGALSNDETKALPEYQLDCPRLASDHESPDRGA